MKKGKRINIADNGEGNLVVYYGLGTVDIYKRIFNDDLCTIGLKLVKSISGYEKLRIGKDPDAEKKILPKQEWFKGHSLLLFMPKDKMIWIGNSDVVEFKLVPGDKFVNYVSPMGESMFPYPYIKGTTHTYLLLENVAIPNEIIGTYADPYKYFYGLTNQQLKKNSPNWTFKTRIVLRKSF